MNNISQLKELRNKMKTQIDLENSDAQGQKRVVVGMATCSIAAGAAPIFDALSAGIKKAGVKDTSVVKAGCIGICMFEPIVEIHESGKEKVTYVKVKPDMVDEIINEHLLNGKIVDKYTIGAVE